MGMRTTTLNLLGVLVVLGLSASAGAADRVRESALAGGWYTADPEQLQAQVDGFLNGAAPGVPKGEIRALIVPHAGYAYSGPTAGQVVSLVKGREYRRVLVLAPSHHSGFHGLSIADVNAYRTPLGDVPLDLDAVKALRASPLVGSHAEAHAHEHSIEIELPLLQRALAPGWRLVPVLVGQLGPGDVQAAADLLRPLADEHTLVLVSSDFTHYGPRFGYQPFPPGSQVAEHIRALDEGAIERILAKDAEGFLAYQADTGITICGYRPIAILLRMLGPGARVERVAYAASGALTGDWSNSVSYAGLVITDPQPLSADTPSRKPRFEADEGLSKADLKRLHRLATLALEDAVLGPSQRRTATLAQALDALPDRLREPAGAFVTLKRHGDLRGCIGTIGPVEPLYQAVLDNGDNAARRDPRFSPVQPDELKDLDVEVSVLTPPHPIASWKDFRVGEQGIILSKDGHRAVFLPEVATEQDWTREQTLSYLSRKAGLPADAWRDGASFKVFTSTKYAAPYAAGAGER
jgi:MEMO1 family protein